MSFAQSGAPVGALTVEFTHQGQFQAMNDGPHCRHTPAFPGVEPPGA